VVEYECGDNCKTCSQSLISSNFRSRYSSVGTATRYELEVLRFEPRGVGEIFLTRPDRPWGPPSFLYNGYRGCLPSLMRPGRGVDHPPPSGASVPMWRVYRGTLRIGLGGCLDSVRALI